MEIFSQSILVPGTSQIFKTRTVSAGQKFLCANHLALFFFVASFLFLKIETAFAQHPDHIAGDILVMLKKGSDVHNVVKMLSLLNGKETGLKAEQNLSQRLNIWQLHFDFSILDENEMLNALKQNSHVLIAQFNHYVEYRNTPNDADFGQQWNMLNIGQSGGIAGADVRATTAWDAATGGWTASGDTIVIAIIDQGFDLTHPDLHYWKNYGEIPNNNIDDDGNGYVDDYDGWNALDNSGEPFIDHHGTHVAGTAGARGNNSIGVAGVNWNVQIMPISGNSGIEDTVIKAYAYALEMRARYNESNGTSGAFVVSANSSFGVNNGQPANYPLWCAMYDSMGKYGILHATATANVNADIDIVSDMPTACPSDYMISVTNTTASDQKNPSAAYGLTTIDLGAPGTGIFSTLPVSQGSYGSLTGCSMSSPHVAGAVALLYSLPCTQLANDFKNDPAGTAQRIKTFILNGVDTLTDLVGRTVSGGRLNVYKSMLLLGQYYNCNVGIDEVSSVNQNVFVYPNPASDVLNVVIKNSGSEDAVLSVKNILGQDIISKNITVHDFSIPVSGLQHGVYFLCINGANENSIVRWVKE
ncbi:MAG TPA: S8 family serine peptidase [Chitinophagales bacterium]|nr:S8 family serine peptidase [Chitinophagales bacterium]